MATGTLKALAEMFGSGAVAEMLKAYKPVVIQSRLHHQDLTAEVINMPPGGVMKGDLGLPRWAFSEVTPEDFGAMPDPEPEPVDYVAAIRATARGT